VKLLANTLAKHNIKQNAEINTYNTIKKGVNKMTNTMTAQQQIDIAEHEQELGCKLRIMSYREWLADTLEVDVEDITGLDMDADSKQIYDTLLEQCPLVLTIEEETL
jgi:hypothetical protein